MCGRYIHTPLADGTSGVGVPTARNVLVSKRLRDGDVAALPEALAVLHDAPLASETLAATLFTLAADGEQAADMIAALEERADALDAVLDHFETVAAVESPFEQGGRRAQANHGLRPWYIAAIAAELDAQVREADTTIVAAEVARDERPFAGTAVFYLRLVTTEPLDENDLNLDRLCLPGLIEPLLLVEGQAVPTGWDVFGPGSILTAPQVREPARASNEAAMAA